MSQSDAELHRRSSSEAKRLLLLYARFEERHGLLRKSMDIYQRACMAAPPLERYELYLIYLHRCAACFGVVACRQIYEQALRHLPDQHVSKLCLRYARLEQSLGEIDRARAIFVYAAQFCDPKVCRLSLHAHPMCTHLLSLSTARSRRILDSVGVVRDRVRQPRHLCRHGPTQAHRPTTVRQCINAARRSETAIGTIRSRSTGAARRGGRTVVSSSCATSASYIISCTAFGSHGRARSHGSQRRGD